MGYSNSNVVNFMEPILTMWPVNSAFVLTALVGSMRGLSMAIVMQLRKMMTSTIWSNNLWVMNLLHRTRSLDKATQRNLKLQYNRSFT